MSKQTITRLLADARTIVGDLVSWRRHLHMRPEPSMGEHETAAFVAEQLRVIGVETVKTGVGKTGVVGLVRGRGSKCVGLRADMDALELEEANDVPYRSRRPGMMHGCGHDAHVACLLGAAALLVKHRAALPGSVKLIFQPGEEGLGGARYMIEEGVLERPRLRAIAALHVDTEVPSGQLGIRRDYDTAQTEDLRLVVHGKSAHAARPDQGVDSIAVASQVLMAIQQFIARHTNLVDRKLITIGIIRGGSRSNILAESVEMIGTMRSLEPEGRALLTSFLKRDLRKLAAAWGARLTVEIDKNGYPPLCNDDQVNDIIGEAATALLGSESVVKIPKPGLGGEDFAYFAQAGLPAALFHLGIHDVKKGFTSPGHSSTFDLDDRRVLPIGAAMLAATAIGMLKRF